MNNVFEIIEQKHEYALVIRKTVSTFKIGRTMGDAFNIIMSYLEKYNISPTRMPFARYTGLNFAQLVTDNTFMTNIRLFTRKWHLEMGFVVPRSLDPEKPIQKSEILPFRCIEAIHRGPYRTVGKTYKEMLLWAKERNIFVKDESWEFYSNDPRVTKQEELETTILIPIQ